MKCLQIVFSKKFKHQIIEIMWLKMIFESNLMFAKCSSNSTSNTERTRTCSSSSDRTRTPNFCLRTNGHRTSNIVRPITKKILLSKAKKAFHSTCFVEVEIAKKKISFSELCNNAFGFEVELYRVFHSKVVKS